MRRVLGLSLFMVLCTAAVASYAAPPAPASSVPPGIYGFYDWQHRDPRTYPLDGGHVTVQWKLLNPAQGRYDWAWLDNYLATDWRLGKRDGVGIDPHDSLSAGGIGVPGWVVARQPSAAVTCAGEPIPNYLDPVFREEYARFIAAFAAAFDGDERLAFIEIGVGLFGETQPAEEVHDPCLLAAGLTSQAWVAYGQWVIDQYVAAFSRTPLLLEFAPRYLSPCERRTLTDYAAARGVGLQHSGLTPDGGGGLIFDDPTAANYRCGQYDPFYAWQGRVSLGWEGTEWGGHTGPQATLWRLYNGLSKHPDFILLDDNQIADPVRRDMILFARDYLGRSIDDTPGVWAALRETEYDWYPQYGNFEFWLYQDHAAPGGRTVPLWRVGDAPEGRYTRRTDEATGNPYVAFDIDDAYLYEVNGPVTLTVTYLDRGLDSWTLEYDGDLNPGQAAPSVRKTDTGAWQRASFVLTDAYFANRQPGGQRAGTDFRIASGGDGDEIIHFVHVTGGERPAPRMTATPGLGGAESETPTLTPTATATATSTPTPTATPVVSLPHPTLDPAAGSTKTAPTPTLTPAP